jgi:hypothetical protein
MLFRMLAITPLPPLGLIFFDSMLALLEIQFFLILHTSSYLTPKGPYVPGVTKPVLVSVA